MTHLKSLFGRSPLCRRQALRASEPPDLVVMAMLLVLAVPLAARNSARFESPLALASSDAQLVEAFSWASRQASAYAFEGDAVGAWFEAALPGREAFCMRDVAHQAMGGARARPAGARPQHDGALCREHQRRARLVQPVGD